MRTNGFSACDVKFDSGAITIVQIASLYKQSNGGGSTGIIQFSTHHMKPVFQIIVHSPRRIEHSNSNARKSESH